MKAISFALYSLILSLLMTSIAGCGNDTTGPTEGDDGWSEYMVGDGFTFEWKTEDSSSTLRVKVTVQTTGWIAIGFDPTSYMEDANLLIGFVENDTSFLRDDFGTGQVTHDADTNLGGTSDIEIIDGSEMSNTTILEFRIPMDSGDQYDKVLVEGNSYSMIFAYGENGADDYTSGHKWAEVLSIEL